MRHADICTTLNIYGDVVTDKMAQANSKVVRMALPSAVKVIAGGIAFRVSSWKHGGESGIPNPPKNVNSKRCKVTDGIFDHEKQCKAVLTDC